MVSAPPLAPAPCSDAPIWDAWFSAFHGPTLAIADDLGVFTALSDRPLATQELAAHLGIEVRATEAILGVLAGLGFLVLVEGKFQLTEIGRTYLLPGSLYYWGPLLRRIRDNPIDCRRFLDILRRGTSAAEAPVTAMWQSPAPPPERLIAFTHGMHAHSFSLAMHSVQACGFAGARRVLDVGGGSGSWSIAAAVHHPELRCVLLDLPVVCSVAREYIERFGLGERIETVSANMFEDPWPEGCDRIFFSDIFHDWNDEGCLDLASRAFSALPVGGQILVHEMLLDDNKAGPLAAATYSMIMLFVTQGRQRSVRELAEILSSAGFTAIAHTPTSGGYAIVTGTKSEPRSESLDLP